MNNPQGSKDLHSGSDTTTSPDHLHFLHPFDMPANCLIASDMDSASKAEAGSDSECSSERELKKVGGISPILFKSEISPWTHALTMRTSKGWKEVPPSRTIISWQRAAEVFCQLGICHGAGLETYFEHEDSEAE